MKYTEPEKLPRGTPAWFRIWHSNSFWHFKYEVESRLSIQNKILWTILTAIIIIAVANMFFGY